MTGQLRKILCVEDERDIQQIAQIALETIGGFEVRVCSTGAEALYMAVEWQPDTILLDVMMPHMDGPATLHRLRQIETLKDVPVIFMTAKVQPQEIRRYAELGAAGVIPKPFDPMSLSARISEIWRGHVDEFKQT